MYLIKIFDKTSNEVICTFESNSFTESYDNAIRHKSLVFRTNQNLDTLISDLNPLEGVQISRIVVYSEEREIITYNTYHTYSRASIEYPEGDPAEVLGIINFAV